MVSTEDVKAGSPGASLSMSVFDGLYICRTIAGSAPFRFKHVALSIFAGAYLTRYLCDDFTSNPLTLSTLLLLLYYVLFAVYHLGVYNRYLNPLLAVPGPRVSQLLKVNLQGSLANWNGTYHSYIKRASWSGTDV
jgi:hypothetical protein